MEKSQKEKSQKELKELPGISVYKNRFLYALFPCGLFCFIYLFFGPLSLIHTNSSVLKITIFSATPYYLLAFAAGTLLSSALLAILRGSLFCGAATMVLWLSLGSYIQRNMLNPDFGLLIGTAIPWEEYTGRTLLNLAFWGALLLLLFLLKNALKAKWEKVLRIVSVIVVLMQTTALVTFYFASDGTEDEVDYALSTDGVALVSENENIIVFILDATSNNALNKTLAVYPDALSLLNDFTYYNNCAPTFYGTYPEMISIFTGNGSYDTNASYLDFERVSWSSSPAAEFYALLKSRAYVTSFYTDPRVLSQTLSNIEGKIDNTTAPEAFLGIQPLKMYEKLGVLTCYEYFPLGLKASFYKSTGEFDDLIANSDGSTIWSLDGEALSSKLFETGLSASESNQMKVYHFEGAHSPYILSDTGLPSEDSTSLEEQVMGCFVIIGEYISQLKEIGAYDSSTIIITADHGDYTYNGSHDSNSAILFVKLRNETHEELQVSEAPVTHLELLPTIAADAGLDGDYDFGAVLADFSEGEPRERILHKWENTLGGPNQYDAFYVFRYSSHIRELNDLTEPDEILPLYDCFY
ncbi:MAG: hypothetical protein Q4B42_00590 [Oscillospiraceae bacterium]|nr:hypothetical protein [Oscillospiraceae bacterium]